MPKQTVTFGSSGIGDAQSATVSREAGQAINVDESIPANTNNTKVDVDFDVSQHKLLFIYATKPLTLKNAASSPTLTISLAGGEPLVWKDTDGQTKHPCGSTDVPSFYVDNTNGTAVDLVIQGIADPTD